MRVTTVESTTLATVDYDEDLKLLQLEFCSRGVYLYFSADRGFLSGSTGCGSGGSHPIRARNQFSGTATIGESANEDLRVRPRPN